MKGIHRTRTGEWKIGNGNGDSEEKARAETKLQQTNIDINIDKEGLLARLFFGELETTKKGRNGTSC